MCFFVFCFLKQLEDTIWGNGEDLNRNRYEGRNLEIHLGAYQVELPVRHPRRELDVEVWGLGKRSALEIELGESSE